MCTSFKPDRSSYSTSALVSSAAVHTHPPLEFRWCRFMPFGPVSVSVHIRLWKYCPPLYLHVSICACMCADTAFASVCMSLETAGHFIIWMGPGRDELEPITPTCYDRNPGGQHQLNSFTFPSQMWLLLYFICTWISPIWPFTITAVIKLSNRRTPPAYTL